MSESDAAPTAKRSRHTRLEWSLLAVALAAAAAYFFWADAEPTLSNTSYAWRLPDWAPEPVVPADNPMTEAKVELGRRLFYEKRLSINNAMSCATCHQQALAFTDGKAVAVGTTGELHPRTTMTLTNVAYLPILTWANPNQPALERQALTPIFGDHPVEMGMAGQEKVLFERLNADSRYRRLFRHAFSEQKGEISLSTITKAIASFQRSLISLRSPYDRFRYGSDPNAISLSAKRGEALFFSERLECYHCHAGFTFNDNQQHKRLAFFEIGYHNNALYNVDGVGSYPKNNPGVAEFTGRAEDVGKFRTPTLRNIGLTAPYMHDGSIATLEEVLRHYAAGGRTIDEGENRGVGAKNPNKSPLIAGFQLSKDEIADVVAFLHSLTETEFVTDSRFADPFAGIPIKR